MADPERTGPAEAPGRAATGAPTYPAVPGYEILGDLGKGGMGEVVRGHDLRLGRDLAVKMLLPKYRDVPDLVQRFLTEARTLGRLQHPGIVPIHELGELPDGTPYFTMKLVEGRTLADLLKERAGPSQDLPRFLGIFQQVCQAVAYAHSKGVIHRDLKPDNVMVGAFGEVQVMDWGLAKVLAQQLSGQESPAPGSLVETVRSAEIDAATQPGAVMGTLAYMAPEQARGAVAAVAARADVFGLGAILCEILTGQPPYAGASREDVMRQAAVGEVAEALARLDGCGADWELVALCQGCLAPRLKERPRDAGEVATRVSAYQAAVQERLRRAELERTAAEARAGEERRRRRAQLGLAAAVLLLAAGGGAWYVQQQQQEHEFELQLAKQQQEHELEVLKKQQEHEFELAKKRQELYAALATRLDEAKRLRDQARAARRVADLEKFTEALLVAEAAQESARAEGFTGDVLKEVADLLAELKDEAAASKRDERLLKGLERFRSGLYALHYAGVGGVFMRTGVAPPGWTDVGSLGERLDPPDPAWRMGIGSQPTPFAPRVGFPGVPAGPWDTLGPMGVQWDIWGRMGVGRQPTPFAPRTGSSVGEDLLRGRSPGAGAAGTEEKTRLALAEKALIEKQGLVDVLGKLFDEWNESLSFYVPPAKGVADRIRQRPGLVVADVKTTLDMYIKGYFRGETKKYPYLRDLASALPDG